MGEHPQRTDGLVQRLMHSRVIPAIYERWWRPGLARLAKGPFGPSMAEEQRLARELLDLRGGDRVLDVACGPGNFTRSLADAVGPTGLVVGIDGSPTMLRRARADTDPAAFPSARYVMGDAERLPVRAAAVDAVCCFAALYLFAHPYAAVDELTRVLAPGGRIALLASAQPKLEPPDWWTSFVERRTGIRIFDRTELTDALTERGYVDVRQRITGLIQFVSARRPSGAEVTLTQQP